MNMRQLLDTAIVGLIVGLAPIAASAQTAIRGGSYNFGPPTYVPIYGGYYGSSEPSIAVTPFGARPIGYGYNGYTGSGAASDTDWDMLRTLYEQGYQAAIDGSAGNSYADSGEMSYPTGMTATPRGVTGRVPHGSDGVKMWRVGRSSVVLRWMGDSRIASSVTFELTDKAGRTLRRTTLRQLPAEVHFIPPANAYYYLANVRYVDGATNTIMSRLPH